MLSALMLVMALSGAGAAEATDAAGNAETPTAWEDAPEVTGNVATGTVELCETLTTPLGWIPNAGTALGILAEWGCLVPGAVAGDYVQRQHGTRRGHIWQGTVALAVGKLWRDATRVVVAASIVVSGVGVLAVVGVATGVLGLTVWPVAPLFIPLAVAGVVMGGAITYAVVREVRKGVQEALFRGTYALLTRAYPTHEEQRVAQRTHLLRPRLNILERNGLLAAAAAGAEADHRIVHHVPVVGPVMRGVNKGKRLQQVVRRVAAEDLEAKPLSWRALDGTILAFTVTEGVLGSVTQVALATGALLVVVGGVLVLAQLPLGFVRPQASVLSAETWARTWANALLVAGPPALATGLLGVVALGVVGSGVLALALREVPKALLPWVVPLVFGPIPEGKWFPPRIPEEPAATPASAPAEAAPLDDVDTWAAPDGKTEVVPAAEPSPVVETPPAAEAPPAAEPVVIPEAPAPVAPVPLP